MVNLVLWCVYALALREKYKPHFILISVTVSSVALAPLMRINAVSPVSRLETTILKSRKHYLSSLS